MESKWECLTDATGWALIKGDIAYVVNDVCPSNAARAFRKVLTSEEDVTVRVRCKPLDEHSQDIVLSRIGDKIHWKGADIDIKEHYSYFEGVPAALRKAARNIQRNWLNYLY